VKETIYCGEIYQGRGIPPRKCLELSDLNEWGVKSRPGKAALKVVLFENGFPIQGMQRISRVGGAHGYKGEKELNYDLAS